MRERGTARETAPVARGRASETVLGAGRPSARLGRELVAVRSGGRMVRLDTPTLLVRAVGRRDVSLALAHAVSALACAAVDLHGTREQRTAAARTVLDGGRLALLLPDATPAAHRTDGPATATRLPPRGEEADAHVTFTEDMADGSLTAVMAGTMLGPPGQGARVLLDALRFGWPLLVSVGVGAADAVLRGVVGAAGVAGVRSLGSSLARRAVTDACADLLVTDCLVTVAVRALHLAPEHTAFLSAAARHLGPRLLREGAEGLLPVLGPHAHSTHGEFGALHGRLRTLTAPTSYGPGGLDVLTALVTRPGRHAPPVPDGVHVPGGPLPPPVAVPVTATARPGLRLHAEDVSGPLGALVRLLAHEAALVRAEFRTGRAAGSAPVSRAAADRYALLHAAACCLGVARTADPDFLGTPHWLTAALSRVVRRLGLPLPQGTEESVDAVYEEALTRCRDGVALDLYAGRWP
ncbi:hypothetical protein K4B79_14440 [Streptomyces lincolnensis]|uniref:hypothetical protein n=1 Tax=Streptomyces lincolnensis TaxID=1915 RepID=UPI001E5CA531|nr:hypothetical protein [Streptomyces lincolnensis]MCD7439426.1 hypothetical protein [Streptomyces lincolnensis]